MIKPTLFVGLGTTGTKILKSLRQLMAEEYTRAGLPIFRYIAIETDGDEKGEDPSLMSTERQKDYEQITVVSATIDDTGPIRLRLTPGHPLHKPQLAEWLNPQLLDFAQSFQAGASNIRMAGRLCLWENWEQMQNTFFRARDAIIAPATTQDTVDILNQHYTAQGQVPDGRLVDSDAINVYVVGSLCGGSCSGMLIDIAYFFRNLLSGNDANRIYGIFTMYDKEQATGHQDTAVRAANCYASLAELNYYNHSNTRYDVTFPSGHGVGNPTQKPFDYAMLVSRSGKNPLLKFTLPGGGFDEEGLNLMVALNLFAEAAGDTDGQKEAIRTDWESFPGYGNLKPVQEGEIAMMVRCLASFGLTAVWYPKYRIASASACLISQKLCENWQGAHVPKATSVADADQEWKAMLRGNMDVLTHPEGQSPLKSRIESHLSQARQEFGKENTTARQLETLMQAFPPGEGGPFHHKFAQGGQYFELMDMQVVECKKKFREAIGAALNNQLARIDFQGTYGLGDVRAFFQALDGKIKDTIDSCPDRLSTLNLDGLDFEPMHRAENNRWTKLIGLQAQSVEAHRKALIDIYCRLISGDRESIYLSLRNYFLRPVLQEVREMLGFGVQPRHTDGPNPPQTIKQRLDQVAANLGNCIRKFKADYDFAVNAPKSECVKIVANNPQNRIDVDADALRHQIASMDTHSRLLNGKTMREFLERSSEDITRQMTETYRQLALAQIQVDAVVTKAQALLTEKSNDIGNLAGRSNPYQTFRSVYQPFALATPPQIIFGHDPTGHALPNLQHELTGPNLGFPRLGPSSVDHLLFFYQEEAGFALDDLEAYETLKQHFEQSQAAYGHQTHQNPELFDLALHHKGDLLARWCRALARLVPEICSRVNSEAFSGVFRLHHGRYVFEYYVDGLVQTLGLSDDPGGIKRLSRQENKSSYDDFIKAVQSKFSQLGRETVDRVINQLLGDVANLDARRKLSDFYKAFLDEVYPEGDVEPPDSDGIVDAHFHTTRQQPYGAPPYAEPAVSTENPPVPSNPVGGNTMANTNASAEGYEEHSSEEAEHASGAFAEAESENVQRHPAASTGITGSSTAEDESVWAEGEPGTESGQTSEPTEAVASEPPPESAQEKQAAPPKPFSVADVDIKRLK